LCRVHGFSSREVQADNVAFGVFVLQRSHYLLLAMISIFKEYNLRES
jgi:hypothetical protein